jgi:SAM-dependent methyltransferase
MTPADERAIADMQPKPFLQFVAQHVLPGNRVAEIGCGPGRATLFLASRGIDVVAVDISRHSLRLARERAPAAQFLCASNLDLPLRSGRFDVVVSDGVIHHTPDPQRSFAENVRLLRSGGVYYLGVYKRRRYYYYLYLYIGRPLRWLERRSAGRRVLMATAVPLYWLAHQIKSGGRRTWRGAVNFFYDYFITPQASFHTYEEICAWGALEGLQLLDYDPGLGNVHVFVFRRPDRTVFSS